MPSQANPLFIAACTLAVWILFGCSRSGRDLRCGKALQSSGIWSFSGSTLSLKSKKLNTNKNSSISHIVNTESLRLKLHWSGIFLGDFIQFWLSEVDSHDLRQHLTYWISQNLSELCWLNTTTYPTMLEQPKTMITATTKMTTKSATWHARACRAGCSHFFFFVSGNFCVRCCCWCYKCHRFAGKLERLIRDWEVHKWTSLA